MKTEDFISMLATGIEPVDQPQLRRRRLLTGAAGFLVSVAVTVMVLRVNPLLSLMSREPMFWVRELFCLSLGASALLVVSRLGRPGRTLGLVPLGLVLPLLVMWALALYALVAVAPIERVPLMLGHTARACSVVIALLASPLWCAFMVILRSLAPTRLRLAGGAAGFAAGGIGALIYTLHCPELAAPFIGVWYVLGALLPTAVGAWLGPRLLRW